MRDRWAVTAILTAAAFLLFAWAIRPALFVITLSALYAFITWPLTRALNRRTPRAFAVLAVNIGIALALAGAALAAGPYLLGQIRSLLSEMPAAVTVILQSLPGTMHDELNAMLRPQNGGAMTTLRDALQAGFGFARSAAGVGGALILIPVLAAYLQYDAPRYERALFDLLPAERLEAARRLLADVSRVAGAFIRAQFLVSGIVGLLVYLVLLLTGVPFAPAIAVLTAVADLVPYLGGVAAFVPTILLALAFGGIWKALLAAVLLAIVFAVEAQLLQPQIVGARTHLPPSAVVITLLIGGALFGVVGMYLAVPAAASVPSIIRFLQSGDADSAPRSAAQ